MPAPGALLCDWLLRFSSRLVVQVRAFGLHRGLSLLSVRFFQAQSFLQRSSDLGPDGCVISYSGGNVRQLAVKAPPATHHSGTQPDST